MRAFTFNGINSADKKVWLEQPPEIESGAIRAETQTVLGSARVLHYIEDDDAMDPIRIRLECIAAAESDAEISAIAAWLRGGGELILPDDPSHSYRAWIVRAPNMSRAFRTLSWRRLSMELECEAHRYQYPPLEGAALSQGALANPGTAPAEPLIKLYGAGDISITIGESTLAIEGVEDYVMIDCEARMVYREDVNLGTSVTRTGDWPVIPAGGCEISWSEGVTAAEITPRWRDY